MSTNFMITKKLGGQFPQLFVFPFHRYLPFFIKDLENCKHFFKEFVMSLKIHVRSSSTISHLKKIGCLLLFIIVAEKAC